LVTGAKTRAPSAPDVDPDRLGGQRAALGASLQRHPLGGFAALSARGVRAVGVTEPDERSSAEVGDEEGDLARTQLLPEMLAEHVGGGDRGRVLDGREQFPEVQPCRWTVRHPRQPTDDAAKAPRAPRTRPREGRPRQDVLALRADGAPYRAGIRTAPAGRPARSFCLTNLAQNAPA
jgi:hypothetical protein